MLRAPSRSVARSAADRAALSALLICRAREIDRIPGDAGLWRIPVQDGWLEMRPERPSLTGLAPIGSLAHATDSSSRPLTDAEALELLIAHLRRNWPATGPALADRALHSHARIEAIAAARLAEPPDTPDFLAAEQAVIFGHWMHPSPKALGGMTDAEERSMTPDWRGKMRLHGLSVASGLVEAGGPEVTLPGFDGDPGMGRRLVPAHPLTLDRLRQRPEVAALFAAGAIRDLGPMGPEWYATSSVRTLWSPDCDWMVKASIPVRVTNSERVNKRHELLAGEAMARHLNALPSFGPIRFVTDPAWLTLRLPRQEESGFELIFRENPWRGGRVMQVAGLVQPGLPGRASLLAQVMAGHDPARWFAAYLDVALDPMLAMYDATGIAFEAHQQNVLLDLTHGLPTRADLRDNQGFYIDAARATPEMRAIPHLVYPRAEAEAALGYTLLVNQIFGVIHRMDADALLPEPEALSMLAARLGRLTALPGHGGRLAAEWLRAAHLPAKGNMLTQLTGVDELHIPGERAPYIQVPNPIPSYAAGLRHVA